MSLGIRQILSRFSVKVKTGFPSVSATQWWSREMFHQYIFSYLHATDEREVTIMEWVRQMFELNKIPEGVRVKSLRKILDEEDPNHDVMELAMMKVEIAGVLHITKPLREVTYTPEGDGPLALITTDILNRSITELEPAEYGLSKCSKGY